MSTPILARALLNLRTTEVQKQQEHLVQKYVQAIRAHVFYEAKYGMSFSVKFWLLTPENAHAYLQHVSGQPYMWNRNYVRKTVTIDRRLRKPIPYELIEFILPEVYALFPDCEIEVVPSAATLGGETQDFLVIRWG